jgi:hypothetical protein
MTTQELSPPAARPSSMTRGRLIFLSLVVLAAIVFNLDVLVNIPSNEIAFFVAGVLVSAIIGWRSRSSLSTSCVPEAEGPRTKNREPRRLVRSWRCEVLVPAWFDPSSTLGRDEQIVIVGPYPC